MSILISNETTENTLEENVDQTEVEIQRILTLFSEASPEVQSHVLIRLLGGLSSKVTGSMATQVIKAASTIIKPQGKIIGQTTSPKNKKIEPWLNGSRRDLKDPLDPTEAWEKFGSEPLFRILYFEPEAILEAMLTHPNMPRGAKIKSNSSSATLAKAIITRLEKHFRVSDR